MNPKVTDGSGVNMMCQCRSILGKKCTILVNDVFSGGDNACVGKQELYGKSLCLPFNLVVNLKVL